MKKITGYKNFRAGLLGRKLGHSYSKIIHEYIADYSYEMFEKEENEVGNFIKNGNFDAINVTVPYKKTVIPFLDELSESAKKLEAVNTVVRREDGTLYGDNTDVYGFAYMLHEANMSVRGKKALVLGRGGAASTVCHVLENEGAREIVSFGSRDNTPENTRLHSDAEIIVNATPVGMFPENDGCPTDLLLFSKCEGVADLIYNPARTNIMCDAEKLGIKTAGGLTMLVAQAKRACEIFLSDKVALDDEIIPAITEKIRFSQENIIFIGMPGSGKSTLGKYSAEKLGRTFVDTDAEIERLAGKTIPEIFAEDGEDAFRYLESTVAENVGKMTSAVIATGGGIIKREKNYRPLHQNGNIIFLKRDISSLATDGRPLSKRDGVEKLYVERLPLYKSFADFEIDLASDVRESYERLAEILNIPFGE